MLAFAAPSCCQNSFGILIYDSCQWVCTSPNLAWAHASMESMYMDVFVRGLDMEVFVEALPPYAMQAAYMQVAAEDFRVIQGWMTCVPKGLIPAG